MVGPALPEAIAGVLDSPALPIAEAGALQVLVEVHAGRLVHAQRPVAGLQLKNTR